jgi:hypothetical protein
VKLQSKYSKGTLLDNERVSGTESSIRLMAQQQPRAYRYFPRLQQKCRPYSWDGSTISQKGLRFKMSVGQKLKFGPGKSVTDAPPYIDTAG